MSYLAARFGNEENLLRLQSVEAATGAWADRILAQDDDAPPYVLGHFLARAAERAGEQEAEEKSSTNPAAKIGVTALAASAAGFLFRAMAMGARFVLNVARSLIGAAIRVSWRLVLRPLVSMLFSAMASPAGLVILGVSAGATLGYLLYQYLADDPTKASPEPNAVEPMPFDGPDQGHGSKYREDGLERETSQTSSIMDELPHQPVYEEPQGLERAASSKPRQRKWTRQEVAERTSAASSAVSRRNAQRISQVSGGKPKSGGLDKGALFRAMERAGITDTNERAMFLAQMHHESGNFRYPEEIWKDTKSQLGYEGRKDLGNTEPGDGYRYRGRGFIQLTGRDNYTRAGKFLGLDLAGNPDLAADSDIAASVAIWYWTKDRPRTPKAARAGNVDLVSMYINGGELGKANGIEHRRQLYAQYLAELKANPTYGSEFTKPAAPPAEMPIATDTAPAPPKQEAPTLPIDQGKPVPTHVIRVNNKLIQVPL